MSTRRDMSSWLEGARVGSDAPRAELPADGPGSLAPMSRRVGALAIDWLLCLVISASFFPATHASGGGLVAGDPTATLAVFAVSTWVLVSFVGHTIGHRLFGLRVVPVRGPGRAGQGAVAPGVLPGLVRTLLLCLVIPAAIWDSAGRGMHDVAARTAIVRR